MPVLASAAHRWLERAYGWVGRRRPDQVFQRYAALCRASGVDRLYLVVSFDCDTPEDLQVVEAVCGRLADLQIPPVLAIPGELMRQGAEVCRRLASAGAEFLNHGNVQHTRFDQAMGTYRSCFFYDQLPADVVRRDIVGGDAAVRDVVGRPAAGFRAPHFGTCQSPHQLRFLHRVLRELGCRLSSSTTPLYGWRYGPVFNRFGVWEVPVAGMGTRPASVLDTWSCFAAPERRLTPDDYVREAEALLAQLVRAGCGVLNCYADPIHIHREERFFDVLRRWSALAQAVTYTGLLERLPGRHD